MTPLSILRRNLRNDKLCSFMFALLTFIGSAILNILLEINYFPVTKRGFFCNDNSIKYPYQDESVSSKWNVIINNAASIATFLLGEFNFTNKGKNDKNKEGKITPKNGFGNHLWFVRSIKLFMMCSWCSSITLTLSSIIKTEVGWLRPNFLAICNPNITCSANNTQYNEDFICLGTEFVGEWKHMNDKLNQGINQARRSFPSGHASYTASFAAFNILYIEKRIISSDEYVLFKPFIQFIWVGIATFISLSRVMDYYHHLQDVIFGAFLGCFVAIIGGKVCMSWLINTSNDKFNASNKVYPAVVKSNVNKSV